MTPRRLIILVTAVLLTAALVINVVWFGSSTGTGRFEPVVGLLSIVAAITGLFAERRAAAREARDTALAAIAAELTANADLLDTAFGADATLRRTVFPRLHLSAVDAAFVGGSLGRAADAGLVGALHGWRNQVVRFNAQLSLAEILAFTATSDTLLRDLDDELHSERGPLPRLHAAIADLLDRLGSSR